MINKRIYITPAFTELLAGMNVGLVEYITVYKIEGDNIFFAANKARLHLTKEELAEVQVSIAD
jgi:hypothetical protein